MHQQRGAISILIVSIILILSAVSALIISVVDDEESSESITPNTNSGYSAQQHSDSGNASQATSQVQTTETEAAILPEYASGVAEQTTSSSYDSTNLTKTYEQNISTEAALVTDDTDAYEEVEVTEDVAREADIQQWWSTMVTTPKAASSVASQGTASDIIESTTQVETADQAETNSSTGASVSDETNIDASDSGIDNSTTETEDDADTDSSTDNDSETAETDIELPDANTVYCGKTMRELYDWYQVDRDSAFDFMWNCDEI